jgi:hypothetical protein
MCLSHLIYTVRPCLIHTCHAAPMPCSDHAVLLKVTAQHGRRETAMLCCGLEKNGMVRAWHVRGMASVNQALPHFVNQMGKTHSKPLAARHGRGTAWARHAMCESVFNCMKDTMQIRSSTNASQTAFRDIQRYSELLRVALRDCE